MCTSFYIEPDNPILQPILRAAESSRLLSSFWAKDPAALITEGEVTPGSIAAILAPDSKKQRAVFPMKWGYRLNGQKTLFQIQLEDASEKNSSGEVYLKRRCIIPASYYFEWKYRKNNLSTVRTGTRYVLQPVGRTVTWLCGCYRIENGLPYFMVVTRKAGPDLKKIRDRMPLILPQDLVDKWISPGQDPGKLIRCALTDMIAEKTCPP